MGGEAAAAARQDEWELYDTRRDFSLANDLAAKNPKKLKELQALFLKEAVKYSVLPIDDRASSAQRGAASAGPTSWAAAHRSPCTRA